MKHLHRINRWWENGRVLETGGFKLVRREFGDIEKLITQKRIIAIIGPRRVGKSTLLYQTIEYLLSTGTDPKRILFFNADAPGLWLEAENIDDIMEYYAAHVLGESMESLSKKVYVFIDEIHFIKNWQLYLKSIYDLDYNVKFIISGSSASHMFAGSKESLLGRIDDVNIMPLDFSEFIRFSNALRPDRFVDMPEMDAIDMNDPEPGYEYLYLNKGRLALYEPRINSILKEYLLYGGYPEYFSTPNTVLWQKRLIDDVMERGLYRDIISVYGVRQPLILEQLVYFVAANQGQAFSFNSISSDLKTDTSTIIQYITYLSQSKLLRTLECYTKSMATTIKKNRKLYVCDNGIRNAILGENLVTPDIEGQLVENCCAALLDKICSDMHYKLYYWREGKLEIDFIINLKSRVLPVEVKYRTRIDSRDTKTITGFMAGQKSDTGMIITRNKFAKEAGVYSIPFWMYAIALKR